MAVDASAVDEIPRRCGECGYELRGLPDRGRCPECGKAYTPEVIILFGWACGQSATGQNARGGRAVWAAIGGYAYLLFQAVNAAKSGTYWIAGGLGGLIGVLAVYQLVQRHSAVESTGAACQLRLSPLGYGLRDGVGPVTLRPWSKEISAKFLRIGPGRYRITIRWNKPLRLEQVTDFECDASDAFAGVIRATLCEWAQPLGVRII